MKSLGQNLRAALMTLNAEAHTILLSFYITSRGRTGLISVHSTAPPTLEGDQLAKCQCVRIPASRAPFGFLPDLMATAQNDVKPLHIVQPDGNWKRHVSFHHREGIALSTITYNDHGKLRPVLYRLSLAKMVVPYTASEHPHARKFAFDSGEYGMGVMANELTLGCDCLGQIHYLPGTFVKHDGTPHIIQNCICIHEEDAGVLWKQTNFRRALADPPPPPPRRQHGVHARRPRIILNSMFYQDGSIEMEIRLTGILQVYYIAAGRRAESHRPGLRRTLPTTPFVAADTVLKAAAARQHYSTGRDLEHGRAWHDGWLGRRALAVGVSGRRGPKSVRMWPAGKPPMRRVG
ncbi:copper amine oxidase [Mycena filopes]|nr:copper amine oxidase [Mycena filopes]